MIVLAALSSTNIISWSILIVIAAVVIQYLCIASFTFYGSRTIGLNKKDALAVMFCSSQKTVTVAAVIGITYFGADSIIYGLIYHVFQQVMGQVTARMN